MKISAVHIIVNVPVDLGMVLVCKKFAVAVPTG